MVCLPAENSRFTKRPRPRVPTLHRRAGGRCGDGAAIHVAVRSWYISTYQYGVNSLSQRETVDGLRQRRQHDGRRRLAVKNNLRGELTSTRNRPYQTSSTASRFYEFDGIGTSASARESSPTPGHLTSYTPNNQYTTITTTASVSHGAGL